MEEKEDILELKTEISFLKKRLKEEEWMHRSYFLSSIFFIAALYAFFVSVPDLKEYPSAIGVFVQTAISIFAGGMCAGLTMIISAAGAVFNTEKKLCIVGCITIAIIILAFS